MYACICVKAHVCKSGNNLQVLVLSFHHAGLGDWIDIIRLGSRFLHMLSHLSHPCLLTLIQAFSMANRASSPVEIKLKWLSHLLMSEWLWTAHFNCLYSCFHLWNKSRDRHFSSLSTLKILWDNRQKSLESSSSPRRHWTVRSIHSLGVAERTGQDCWLLSFTPRHSKLFLEYFWSEPPSITQKRRHRLASDTTSNQCLLAWTFPDWYTLRGSWHRTMKTRKSRQSLICLFIATIWRTLKNTV